LQAVFLVGGFAASEYLYAKLKEDVIPRGLQIWGQFSKESCVHVCNLFDFFYFSWPDLSPTARKKGVANRDGIPKLTFEIEIASEHVHDHQPGSCNPSNESP
jgi:hypothetical protein